MRTFKERIQLIKELRELKKEYLEKHRKMWDWIADTTLSNKKSIKKLDYMEHIGISRFDDDRPRNNCYCCEFDRRFNMMIKPHREDYIQCKYCPVKWYGNKRMFLRCEHRYSQYMKYICLVHDHKNDKLSDTKVKRIAGSARGIANISERRLVFLMKYIMILLGV